MDSLLDGSFEMRYCLQVPNAEMRDRRGSILPDLPTVTFHVPDRVEFLWKGCEGAASMREE